MRRMTIDRALVWAFREELPKCQQKGDDAFAKLDYRSIWSAGVAWAQYTNIPDNLFGVPSDPYAQDEPHPAAVALYDATVRISNAIGRGDVGVDLPDDWDGSDGTDYGCCRAAIMGRVRSALWSRTPDAETMHPRLSMGIVDLMRSVAVLGLADCVLDECEVVPLCHANGQPRWFRMAEVQTAVGVAILEVDGMNRKRRMPYADAYHKYEVAPDPVPSLINRAWMEMWRSAIDLIFDEVGQECCGVEIEPCPLPSRPWETASRHVLPSLIR